MEVECFEIKHREILEDWFQLREMEVSLIDELPDHGCIVVHQGRYIAAGFLRRLENCSYALIDSVITNPKMPSHTRDKALDILSEQLIRMARELELKSVMALSDQVRILERSLKHGFEVLSHQLMNLKLE